MNALVKIDGYDGFTTETVTGQDAGAFPAQFVKFSNDHRYVLRDGIAELPRDKEYIAPDVLRHVVKWPPGRDQAPERHLLAANEPWPDLKARNEDTPKDEWVVGSDGTLKGPWEMEHQLLLLDAETMAPYLFVTQTSGGHRAVSELAHQTKMMRRVSGSHVCPVIVLSTALWSKRFNRLRPHFPVKRYVAIGGEAQPAELPGPNASPQGGEAAKPARPVVREVKRPPLREELKDQVEY